MNKADQRAAAKELYLLGWEQGKIARLVNVTEATISNWVNKGDTGTSWREERAQKFSLEESISSQVLELIDYQLSAIRSTMEFLKKEKEAAEDKDGKKLPTPLIGKGEIDALSKMFATVKQKDVTWTHYVTVCRELAEFVATKDSEFAKTLMDFSDVFLMDKRDKLM